MSIVKNRLKHGWLKSVLPIAKEKDHINHETIKINNANIFF